MKLLYFNISLFCIICTFSYFIYCKLIQSLFSLLRRRKLIEPHDKMIFRHFFLLTFILEVCLIFYYIIIIFVHLANLNLQKWKCKGSRKKSSTLKGGGGKGLFFQRFKISTAIKLQGGVGLNGPAKKRRTFFYFAASLSK